MNRNRLSVGLNWNPSVMESTSMTKLNKKKRAGMDFLMQQLHLN